MNDWFIENKCDMNLYIRFDIQENIAIATDTYLTVDGLLAAVCDYPFLTNIIIEQTIPQLRKFTEVNYECELSINTFCTIEGHTSIEVHLEQSLGAKKDVCLVVSILKMNGLIPLLKRIVRTLAGFLPLSYAVCDRCGNRHKHLKWP